MAHPFVSRLPEPEARQTVADFEGAILLSRIDSNGDYFDRVCERVTGYL